MTAISWCACRSACKHDHILLPKGFIQGQKLQETLRQLTLPFGNVTDFDRLPTPFRAVATDLETGEAVLLDHGDLSIAMRASISAPGVFAPVDDHGRLLVDGGLAENLPIDVARAMGADVLIVSDVSFPLQPRERLDSALSISNQMLAILVRKDSDRQKATLGPRDILIEPDLGHAAADRFLGVAGRHHAQGEVAARARSRGWRRCASATSLSARIWRGARRASRDCRSISSCASIGIEALREDDPRGDAAAGRQAARPGCGGHAHHRTVRARIFRNARLHGGASKGEGADAGNTDSRCARGANPGVRITCASA